jgi:hypothetical protein
MEFGDKVRDEITGYEGVYVARTDWLYGCRRLGIMRADKDGKPETEWFDEPQVSLVETKKKPRLAATGGGADSQRRADPNR